MARTAKNARSPRAGAHRPADRPAELLAGTLDMMILRSLAHQADHGYGIARRIRRRSDDILIVEEGSLYPALHRLENRGDLRSEWRRSENNRRARFYSLTPTGRARLRAEARAWNEMAGAIAKVMSARLATGESLRRELA